MKRKGLLEVARAAMRAAYAPYSGFSVGAALETAEGEIFAGCNVENASLGLAICAERVAITSAIAAGHRRFRRIAIVTSALRPVAPCGACRQFMAEFGDLEVLMGGRRAIRRVRLSRLLPVAFGPEDLRTGRRATGRTIVDAGRRKDQ